MMITIRMLERLALPATEKSISRILKQKTLISGLDYVPSFITGIMPLKNIIITTS